jgi:hypothetical protein
VKRSPGEVAEVRRIRADLVELLERPEDPGPGQRSREPVQDAVRDRHLQCDELELGPKITDDLGEQLGEPCGREVLDHVEQGEDAWPERQAVERPVPRPAGPGRNEQRLDAAIPQIRDRDGGRVRARDLPRARPTSLVQQPSASGAEVQEPVRRIDPGADAGPDLDRLAAPGRSERIEELTLFVLAVVVDAGCDRRLVLRDAVPAAAAPADRDPRRPHVRSQIGSAADRTCTAQPRRYRLSLWKHRPRH